MTTVTTYSEPEAVRAYSDVLDEAYGTVEIAGLVFETSRALRQLDPIAFRTGMLDWADSEGIDIE